MEDTCSTRCKACDKLFSSVWHEDKQTWEELCWECLHAAFFAEYNELEVDHDIMESFEESRLSGFDMD